MVRQESRPHNTGFASGVVTPMKNRGKLCKLDALCFYYSKVLNSSIVHFIKFGDENPHLRKEIKSYRLLYTITIH